MRLAIILAFLLLAGCTTPAQTASTTTTPASTTTTTAPTSPPATSTPTTTTAPVVPTLGVNKESGLFCDPRIKTAFTSDITNTSNITTIMPLGNIVSDGVVKSHSYVALKGGRDQPVHAPADSSLFRVAYYTEADEEQWLLFFQTDCTTWYILDHLDNVTEKIRAVAPSAPANNTISQNLEIPVEFAAGEIIGLAHARGSGGAFDFGVYDSTYTNTFINPRERNSRDLHAVCPWSYYADASAYTSKFARAGGSPIANASCRSSSRDVAGTLAGEWHRDEAQLAIAMDIDGSVVASAPGLFVRQEAPARDPATVNVGEKLCYADTATHVTIRLMTATTIDMRYGGGPCPTEQEPPGNTWTR